MSTYPTGWETLEKNYSFTTIFGTALNGSEITWINNQGADAASTERTELKIRWVQNLFTSLYTFYDSTETTDALYFVGNYDYNGTGAGVDYIKADDNVTGGTVQDPYNPSDTLYHMQIANPISSGTPTYDGFWTLMKTKYNDSVSTKLVSYHDDNSGGTAGAAGSPNDLVPASDYDLGLDSAQTSDCTAASG
jgi:hypothetical protein